MAERTEFWDVLSAIETVTLDDFAAAGLQAWQWAEFKIDRLKWLVRAKEEDAEAAWRAIEARAFPASPS